MGKELPEVILQPLTVADLEFLPIGTPVLTSSWRLLKFLADVNYKARITRDHEGEKLEKFFDTVGFVSGFGVPVGQPMSPYRGHSSVTSYHLEHDHYQVVVSPRLDELEPFFNEGYEHLENLLREAGLAFVPKIEQGIYIHHDKDNPYDGKTPMGMVWYEGFLAALKGRPNPFRNE